MSVRFECNDAPSLGAAAQTSLHPCRAGGPRSRCFGPGGAKGGGRHLTSPVYEDLRISGPGLLIVVEPPDPEVNDVDQSFLQHPFNSSALEILPVMMAWPWCAQFTCK